MAEAAKAVSSSHLGKKMRSREGRAEAAKAAAKAAAEAEVAVAEVPPEKRCFEDDTLTDHELKQAIVGSKLNGIEVELTLLAKRIAPSDQFKKDCQRALALLRSAGSQEFTAWSQGNAKAVPQLEVIGSSLQGTELDGADLDVGLRWPAPVPPEEERFDKMMRFRERLMTLPQTTYLETYDPMREFLHAPCRISVRLKGKANDPPRVVAHLLTLDHDEIKTGQVRQDTIDIAIKKLCDTFEPRAREVIRLVKLWASIHGLMGQAYMGGLAWTVLVLCSLQKKGYVSPLLSSAVVAHSGETPTLTALLRDFFQFASTQPRVPWGLSLTEGKDCVVPPALPDAGGQGQAPAPLFLEDPVALKRGLRQNLASTLGETQWAHIVEECRKVADRLDATRPQRWFHWAEVFDPSSLTPAGGTKKLPKLSEMSQSLGL